MAYPSRFSEAFLRSFSRFTNLSLGVGSIPVSYTHLYMADHPQYVYPLHYKDGTPLLRNTWLLCPDQPENLRPEVQSFIREALDYSRSQPSHA